MDRLNQLRSDAGTSRDSTLDSSSIRSEAYLTANESSKYFSLSEDSSFAASPSKEAECDNAAETGEANTERLISNLSPIPKKNELDSFKIGAQIEAANILSGGVNIFDDNENSYDEDELVIDDAVPEEEKTMELKMNENNEPFDKAAETSLEDGDASPSKDTEVVLQIDGKNVDAIDIGNGLYLYRKDGEEELAAVQLLHDQQPNIKFLKVRENAEGNLEVYEEIEIEVPKEVPTKEGKTVKNTSHIPVKDVNKVNEPICNKVAESVSLTLPKSTSSDSQSDLNKENPLLESKTEVNLNGKMMKFSESRKSPLIGTFTPMTYHSTPNKEGIPLTKTMVDLQLHPSRHSENVKKTIEVHTDSCKQKLLESPLKNANEQHKNSDFNSLPTDKEIRSDLTVEKSSKDEINTVNVLTIQNIQGNNVKACDKQTDKKRDEKNVVNIASNKVVENSLENDQQKPHVNENLGSSKVTHGKTDLSEITKPAQLLSEPVVATVVECESNMKDLNLINDHEKINTPKGNISATNTIITNDSVTSKMKLDEEGPKNTDNVEIDKLDAPKEDKDDQNSGNTEHIEIDSFDDHVEIGVSSTVSSTVNNKEDIVILRKIDNNNKNKEENKHAKTTESSGDSINYNDLKQLEENSMKIIENVTYIVKNDDKELSKNNKVMDQENKQHSYETKKIFGSLQEDQSISDDIKMKLPDKQNVQSLKSPSENVKIIIDTHLIKPDKLLEDSEKLSSLEKDLKHLDSPQIESNICSIVENKIDLKQTEKPNSLKETELKQPEKVSHIEETKDVGTNNDMDLKQSENKRLDELDLHSIDKSKISTVTKKTENESTLLLGNLSENLVKTEGLRSKQADNITSSKLNINALKVVPNVGSKSVQKTFEFTEKNKITNTSTMDSAAAKKSVTVETTGAQKKIDSIKILPVDNEIKIPSAIQQQKEIEKKKIDVKKESLKPSRSIIPKPINNNKAAVPFGKWTEANRQEFLNKIKEAKVPTYTSNTKQLKQPNDLNRRDVLQKIDSQRQSSLASARVNELNSINKSKNESTVFVCKSNVTLKEKSTVSKFSLPIAKGEEIIPKTVAENKTVQIKIVDKDQHVPVVSVDILNASENSKKDPVHRKEINNQDLIDKTIEGIINRAVTAKFGQDDPKPSSDMLEKQKNAHRYTHVTLDEIESKMNELHGIPFVERPPHELPKIVDEKAKTDKPSVIPDVPEEGKGNKIPKPFSNKSQQKQEPKANNPIARTVQESDEEIIEHEPVTGDSDLNKSNVVAHEQPSDKTLKPDSTLISVNSGTKKEAIITENDFDKFARRNSYEIAYENCLTVNFDGKEQHNIVQTVEKDLVPKKLSRNEIMLAASKAKSNKHLPVRHGNLPVKNSTTTKLTNNEDLYPKNYQSKVQIAYQSAMTAKRQQEYPITIIEDQPVKVVFMDSNQDLVPQQLNLQGKELSPPKKTNEWDHFALTNTESMDSDILDSTYEVKSQDDTKSKSKHQRKQVLTPVEAPELELIEPSDLGVEVSPKKKRKIEDSKTDKNNKTLVPKKSYLLNRNIASEDTLKSPDLTKTSLPQASANQPEVFAKHSDAISAIDNLVKAAELLETQSENKHVLHPTVENPPPRQDTPTKRGRGRPRKYPLPDTVSTDSKSPSPVKTPTLQKKPRLIDAKVRKVDTESEDDELSSDDELVKENWTMGKINENIVCPICNKLFRSENVVFKHVKHCTGPSPSRSDSDKRSPRRIRSSQDLDWKLEDNKSDRMDIDEECETNKLDKKMKPKVKNASIDEIKTDVIVIEDTPVKETAEKREKSKLDPNKTIVKPKIQTNNHVCEFCGKTFRQLSYLVSHKLQHKNNEFNKIQKEQVHVSLFSCEICKKEFRKLHHLVQHRIIHNPNPMSSRSSRKSSSEQSDGKTKDVSRPNEDQSAGFRCEPCDKSFRKLHHLVEHRETHDEMNKKCITAINAVDNIKPNPLHNCDICKKSFKKLQHLIEHKEHHLDTSSEKSDDKSVKSSLSTKDIIHECPLCYMVFPNEHSLNKHNIICQKKKKQSASKNIQNMDETNEDDATESQNEEIKVTEADEEIVTFSDKTGTDSCIIIEEDTEIIEEKQPTINEIVKTLDVIQKSEDTCKEIKSEETGMALIKPPYSEKNTKNEGYDRTTNKVPLKSRKPTLPTSETVEIIKIPDTPTPKKKLSAKDKTEATITKRQKTSSAPLHKIAEVRNEDSSDDDEIRYMLNPDFVEDSREGKLFMKVRAKKRNSLQIERPNSKDLVKRRISLQHPPKIPRLKVKPVPCSPTNTKVVVKGAKLTTQIPSDPVPSTDSDDSDVKYSFPVTVKKEGIKETKDVEKKVKRQTIVEKRKSLGNIAKRKSVGKLVGTKHKASPVSTKPTKRRTTQLEHRCDCGQLFSSAALLSRHTTLAHTPPRIRRRRSPPPDEKSSKLAQKRNEKPTSEPKKTRNDPPKSPRKTGVATRKSSVNSDVTRKSSVNSDVTKKSSVNSEVSRKSSVNSDITRKSILNSDITRKSSVNVKTETRKAPKSALKTRRSAPHRGVPVPEKMRKLMDKSKK